MDRKAKLEKDLWETRRMARLKIECLDMKEHAVVLAEALSNLRTNSSSEVDVSNLPFLEERQPSSPPLPSLPLCSLLAFDEVHDSALLSKFERIASTPPPSAFFVKLPSSRVSWINRRFLRPFDPPVAVAASAAPTSQAPTQPQHSTRARQPTAGLNISSTSGKSYV